jgi:hypothetical protein
MNIKLNETTSLYDSRDSIVKFYSERGVISDYSSIEDIVEPRFVNELLKEKSPK